MIKGWKPQSCILFEFVVEMESITYQYVLKIPESRHRDDGSEDREDAEV